MADKDKADNRTQRVVLNYIKDNPGSSLSRIARTLEINKGTLRYYLRTLEKEEMVRSELAEGRRYYYARFLIEADAKGSKSARDLTLSQRRLLRIITDNPGITRSGLLDRSSDNKVKVNRSIEKLLSKKMIYRSPNGGEDGFHRISKERIIREMEMALVSDLVEGKIDEIAFMKMVEELRRMKKRAP